MKKLLLLLAIILLSACEPEEIQVNPVVTPPIVQAPSDAPLPPDPIIDTPKPTINLSNLPEWTLIPDKKFEDALIAQGIDDISDGKVLTNKISTLKVLKVEHAGVTNTTGLENFLSLEFLSLWDNPITSIDLTHNVLLQILGLSETYLETVDLSKNTELYSAEFQGNSDKNEDPNYQWGKTRGFTSLDFSHNLKLQRIYVMCNRLTSLNVRMLPKLTDLWIGCSYSGRTGGNYIKTIDLTGNPYLSTFTVAGGTFEYIDARNANSAGNIMVNAVFKNNPNLTKVRVTNLALIKSVNAIPRSDDRREPWWFDAHTILFE
jgi:hypothetical protein